jgi:hypothetical protein
MTQPRAGWYPDPSDPSRQRYFDGNAWTENYAPFPAPPPGVGQPAKPGKQQWNWKWIAGVGAAAVVLIAIASGGNDGDKKTVAESNTAASVPSTGSATTAKPSKPSGPVVAPAGSSVRDGKFEFQVLGVDRSASKEGIFNPEQAKGEFFVVKLRVTNIGDEARTFWASNQKLIVNGNKYEASSSLSDDGFRQEINPGLSINTKVMFDVPPGAVPEAIVCHDSAFSGGAQLAL